MDRRDASVVTPEGWLRERAEELYTGGELEKAQALYLRLIDSENLQREDLLEVLGRLGMIALSRGRPAEARGYFENAREIEPRSTFLAFALGNCSMAQKQWWSGLLFFLEAIHLSRSLEETAELMRRGALALRQLGFLNIARSMLEGARDRSPHDPRILAELEALHQMEGEWGEALQARDALLELRLPDDPRPLALADPPLAISALMREADELHERMREQMRLLPDDEPHPDPEDAPGLTPLNLPPGLYTLFRILLRQERALFLLASAQRLWAMAREKNLDAHLPPFTLAAAIHWLSERMNWRVETPEEELNELYKLEEGMLRAAVRVLVRSLEVSLLPPQEAYPDLSPEDIHRLYDIQLALLYDEDLEALRRSVFMLE